MAYSFLLIGAGSIGKRHAGNLAALGQRVAGVFDPVPDAAKAISASTGAEVYSDLSDALAHHYDAALICSPNHLHLEHASACAKKGLPFFLEKPAAIESQGTASILSLIEKKKITTMVGCNMRFSKGYLELEAALKKKQLGKPMQILAHFGFYLPLWRPGADYRKNYAAKKEMGGGVLLDVIHEIDYVRALAGPTGSVSCISGHFSELEIETEDVAQLVQRHSNGLLSSIHLDYLDRKYTRWCKVIGSEGSALWDFGEGRFSLTNAKEPRELDVSEDRNLMYVREMEHFIKVLGGKTPSLCPLQDGIESVRIVEAAKRSSRLQGRAVPVRI